MKLRNIFKALRELIHRHKFAYIRDGYVRICDCGQEEWMMSKPYPRVGEPKYTWKDMTVKDF